MKTIKEKSIQNMLYNSKTIYSNIPAIINSEITMNYSELY